MTWSLIMYVHHSSNFGEVVHPFRIGGGEIDTAMTHGRSKVIVPVRAVDSVIPVEIHNVWNIRQIIARPRHGSRAQFHPDLVTACHGRRLPCACRNDEGIDQRIAFIGIQALFGKIDIDPMLAAVSGCYSTRNICSCRRGLCY